MQTYLDNIEIQPNHTYFHKDVGNVMSVTTILNNGKKSNFSNSSTEDGNNLHKCLEFFLKGETEKLKNLYLFLGTDLQNKVKALIEEVRNLDIKEASAELSFVTSVDAIKYGGTVDLLTKTIAVDFKTGELNKKHLNQVATYAISNKKEQGLILWFNKNKLEKTLLNKKETEDNYNEFYNKANNLTGVKNDFDLEIEKELSEFSSLKQAFEEITSKLDAKKAVIANKIQGEGYSSYKLNNFTCFNQKGKETITLTKEAKALLLQSNPDYFKTTTSKPAFIIRGN